ncbi:hypothetical protein Rhopal_001987-T1 [Rhodotorula paludigena]|uniref:Multiple myeloma tumor-associated protein 2-like N-terminal domain-containing protein n=1 Tax=Rhodotorula paludigena TaxID=86838 RepID=A0AAV5G954_9BASI|nr:hypothetical protein Rhopal_001987-T1 [Rhodotorula paludigena]
MFHPTRGGTRGGQGDFKWSDVAADKDREYYLGHSLNAPVGRWQQGKDLTWYNKDRGDAEEVERQRREELKRIKEAEEDALSQALGFAPTPRPPTATGSSSLGAAVNTEDAAVDKAKLKAERRAEKEARRAERDERRKERSSRREERHSSRREERHSSRGDRSRDRDRDSVDRDTKPSGTQQIPAARFAFGAIIPPRLTNATWVATVLHYALRMAETGTAETGVTGRRSG